jgi:caffeoyl-CoA O-methyltransferase
VDELVAPAAERYAEEHTSSFGALLDDAVAWTRENTSEPQMMSGLAEARLLEALIVVGGARSVLEIGTFTGVGALTMAAALPEGGRVTTLEVDAENAAIARRHIDASPFGHRVELIVGDALETIASLDGPFDLVWMDALKSEYPAYYDAVVPKLSQRGVIVADNLFRAGAALDATDERVHNVLLTIGDGVMLAWRR